MKRTTRIASRLGFGILAVLAATVVIGILTTTSSEQTGISMMPSGSSFSQEPDGTELLYNLLRELGFSVTRHRHPLAESFMGEEAIDVIFHSRSKIPVGNDEKLFVENWVLNGGTLILTDDPRVIGDDGYETIAFDSDDAIFKYWMNKFHIENKLYEMSQLVGNVSSDVSRVPLKIGDGDEDLLDIRTVNSFEWGEKPQTQVARFRQLQTTEPSPEHTIRDGYGTVLMRIPHGRGEVWLISDPYFLGNLLVQEVDNAAVAVWLVIGSRGGRAARIMFDEYHLGFVQTRSFTDAARTPLGRALFYLGLVAALSLGVAGARMGKIRHSNTVIGVSQSALVQALASLWEGAGATSTAAEALWRRYHQKSNVTRKHLDGELDRLRGGDGKDSDLLSVARQLDQ